MSIETIKHWQVGDVHIARIVEVNAWEDDITMCCPDATPELRAEPASGCSRTSRRRKAACSSRSSASCCAPRAAT